ncbi:MAG: hypothetical protein N2111_08610 [Candidatus Sumerlaeaceae bacterium]|nr:hypothetical protein [Candidatus Sumerlaeaceae bacterium]
MAAALQGFRLLGTSPPAALSAFFMRRAEAAPPTIRGRWTNWVWATGFVALGRDAVRVLGRLAGERP